MTHLSTDSSQSDASRPREPDNGTAMSLPKIGLIAGIALATLVPNYLMLNLVAEREARQAAVQTEFTRNWGPPQHLYSPILVVPFQSATSFHRQYLEIAPTRLGLVTNLAPQERKRGLFQATVYDAKVEMEGTFFVPAESRLKDFLSDKNGRFLWDQSFVAFGTRATLTGLRADDHISIGGKETAWQPCLEVIRYELDCKDASLVLAKLQADPDTPLSGSIAFKSAVSLRGTTSFNVLFGGKELDVTVRSPWPSPSFVGDALPVTSSVTSQGFEANWRAIEFGSPRIATAGMILDPGMWKGPTIGVDLIEATPIYRMITRVAKYGLLFVLLSFATYFFFEFLSRLRIHVVQYGLLGLSLSLFSLLLLSLAEPIGYTAGYVVSAGLVLIQSSLYTAAVAKRAMPALVFAGMLASLFVFLYVLLGLETYSLLIGALALFAVVSVLMIVTQRVDWSAARLLMSSEAR